LPRNASHVRRGLQQQPGKNIGVAGSPTLVRNMLREGLLDVLTLSVHPVIAARGRRLFEDWRDVQRLDLVGSQTTRSGIAILTYRPAGRSRA
jgi:dihydrofolate reductase